MYVCEVIGIGQTSESWKDMPGAETRKWISTNVTGSVVGKSTIVLLLINQRVDGLLCLYRPQLLYIII